METRQKRPQLSQGNSATVTPRDPLRGPSYCNRGNLARKAKSIHTTSNHFQKCTRTNRRTERNATRSNRLGLGSRATATTVKHDAGAEPTQTAPKRRDLSSRAAAHHHTEQQRAEERCGGRHAEHRAAPAPAAGPPSRDRAAVLPPREEPRRPHTGARLRAATGSRRRARPERSGDRRPPPGAGPAGTRPPRRPPHTGPRAPRRPRPGVGRRRGVTAAGPLRTARAEG